MDEKHSQLWQKLSAALKPQVSPDTFKRWFSAVKLVGATDDAFTFRVPNNIYQFWIESNHLSALQAAITTAFGAPRKISFVPLPRGSTKQSCPRSPERILGETIRGMGRTAVMHSGSIRGIVSNHLSLARTTKSRTRR